MISFESNVRKLLVAYHLASSHDRQQKGVGLDTAKCIQGACARYNELFDAEFASRSGPPDDGTGQGAGGRMSPETPTSGVPPVSSSGEQCLVKGPPQPLLGYLCTEPKGHAGEHRCEYAEWPHQTWDGASGG